MHTLILMRHAKSSWDDPSVLDFDRPLNKRGKKNAPEMGERLRESDISCDRIISSPARRAKATAEAVAETMGYAKSIDFDKRLYMAEVEDFLAVVRDLDEKDGCVMIVGHNPGTEEFFTYLCGLEVEKFPTAAYACVKLKVPWEKVGENRAELLRFDYPKKGK
jgi:phosphohistidine phosphatase